MRTAQKQIIQWIKANKRLPSSYSKDNTERMMGRKIERFCSKSYSSYDSKFHKLLVSKYGKRTWQKAPQNPAKNMAKLLTLSKNIKEFRHRR